MLSYTLMTDAPEHTNDSHPSATNTPTRRASSRAFAVASWVFVAIILVLIFFMSSKSGEVLDTGSGIISIIRRALIAASVSLFGHPVDVSPVGHFTEFFLLGLALANALRLTFPSRRATLYAILIASAYGVTDELHQIFVPGRSCDPMDWLVDTIAAALAAGLFALIVRLKRKRKNSHA